MKKKSTDFVEWLSERGNLTALADDLGITKGAVWQWGGIVPAERAASVEAFTGISRHALRPDIFGEVTA